MKIQVNGEGRTANVGVTVAELLRELDIRPDRVAVEVNTEVLNRQEFERRGLREGDNVEIISFIGGGAGKCGELVIWRLVLRRNHHINPSTHRDHGACNV